MKSPYLVMVTVLFVSATTQAGMLSHSGSGGMRGAHHGRGHVTDGATPLESRQTIFESIFDDLVSDYDSGIEEITDFYSSDDYAEIVDRMELLVDRYDWFLTGVERSLTRLEDQISLTSDDIDFYSDLLNEYESRDDLSEERLERITTRISAWIDHLGEKIESLTEWQAALNDDLLVYTDFSESLDFYLSTVVAAGAGSIDDDETVTAVAATYSVATSLTEPTSAYQAGEEAVSTFAAPEPTTLLLMGMSLALSAIRRGRLD